MSLAEKRLFLLDMDGTIYLSETLFDGTLEFLRYVRAIGGRYLFLTNNSSRGTDAYIAKMARLGIEAFPDDFLTSADAKLTYEKLENCCILLNRGADYVATHPDLVCPTWYGSAPDCGSVIEMLHTATGRRPKVIGKPQPEMALLAMEQTGFSPRETCLIGDRVYTDIACGVNAGIDTIFVLSGEGVMDDIEKYGVQPTYCMQNIREVLNTLEKGEPK